MGGLGEGDSQSCSVSQSIRTETVRYVRPGGPWDGGGPTSELLSGWYCLTRQPASSPSCPSSLCADPPPCHRLLLGQQQRSPAYQFPLGEIVCAQVDPPHLATATSTCQIVLVELIFPCRA